MGHCIFLEKILPFYCYVSYRLEWFQLKTQLFKNQIWVQKQVKERTSPFCRKNICLFGFNTVFIKLFVKFWILSLLSVKI